VKFQRIDAQDSAAWSCSHAFGFYPAFAQDYFSNWFAGVDRTQAEQPRWTTPQATTTPRRRIPLRPAVAEKRRGLATDNHDGGGKGLELIPFEKVEVIFNAPHSLAHHSTTHDGFCEVAFLVKHRLLSANREHGTTF
jgi:hypothetical protein